LLRTSTGHEGIAQNVDITELASAREDANNEYQALFDQFDDINNLWTEETMEQDVLTPYVFLNSMAYEPGLEYKSNWMDEGMRLFELGNIKEAIRAFELEIQQVNPDSATAWRMLGRCHAENDMDKDAIVCLEHAVDRDPYCSEALLALGVSYVNELNHGKALESLKAWITHNPSFSNIKFETDVYGSSNMENQGVDESSFDEVQRLLLQTLEQIGDDTNQRQDVADVLEALGVVYNVSRDYDAAINSLRKAVDIRPNDYQLWNKLGATLANSNQSSEALPAYQKALQLKPRYARAWLNMAISHSNLQNCDEAARCYLQTLSLNPAAIHCWSYLRIALSCSERWELLPLAAAQDLKSFREHFDFMTYNS
jgi:peroxin-5